MQLSHLDRQPPTGSLCLPGGQGIVRACVPALYRTWDRGNALREGSCLVSCLSCHLLEHGSTWDVHGWGL